MAKERRRGEFPAVAEDGGNAGKEKPGAFPAVAEDGKNAGIKTRCSREERWKEHTKL